MPDPVDRLLLEAESLLRSGPRQAAIAAYRRLLSVSPARADAWYNLGYLLKQDGRHLDALEAYEQALQAGIDKPEEVLLNRAVIYSDHLRLDTRARMDLEAALRLAPDYHPARLNLGNLHEERGERAQAIACYERILNTKVAGRTERDQDSVAGHLDSNQFEALSRLSQLTPPRSIDDPLIGHLRTAAANPARAEASSRANLYFALGRAYDKLGDHACAFEAFTDGKRIAHTGHAHYDHAQARRQHDALIRTYASASDRQDDSGLPAPLFICGMFRSGSTLLEQVLATHPQIHAGGELDLLPRLLRDFSRSTASPGEPTPSEVAALSRRYLDERNRLFPDAHALHYITDKRPDNLARIGMIKRMFPRARILHTRRHPMDTGLSIFMQHLNPRGFSYASSLPAIGHHHGEQKRLMAHWKRLYPGDIHDFDYDAFVMSPESELARVLDFLNLEWTPEWSRFHQQSNTVKTASFWQVREPLHARSVGRWRNYAPFLTPLADALAQANIDFPR